MTGSTLDWGLVVEAQYRVLFAAFYVGTFFAIMELPEGSIVHRAE